MGAFGLNSSRPRCVIAGTNSGSGKTTVTLALMKALVKRRFKVQGYKIGPDYIDPGFHTHITGRPSRNLDSWMMPENTMKEIFQRGSWDADISVIEGVMGLFDGRSGRSDEASTADVAKKLEAPVILVVNAESQARSAAAVVHGFKSFDPHVDVAGVVFNKVASEGHYAYLREALASMGGVELLGYLPKEAEIALPERHLGLTPAGEQAGLDWKIDKLSEFLSRYVDLEKIVQLAKRYQQWSVVPANFYAGEAYPTKNQADQSPQAKIKIAIAKDAAFSFYYQDNLDWMADKGVTWVPVSPLKDRTLPNDISGIYLGGGFPELFAGELASNHSFIKSLKAHHQSGVLILAECGGFMYLTKSLTDVDGEEHPMLGLLPGKVKMTSRLKALGYREGIAENPSFLLAKGEKIRGHVFHYSEYMSDGFESPYGSESNTHFNGLLPAYQLIGRRNESTSGFVSQTMLASYFHIHLGSNPGAGYRWIEHLKSNKPI